MKYSRPLGLIGPMLGLLSAALPWWVLKWSWSNGFFEVRTFLYANSIEGDLSGLGVGNPVGVSTQPYDFAVFTLAMVVVASAAGVAATLGASRYERPLLLSGTILFAFGLVMFVAGLSPTVSSQNRSIFSTETLSFGGSTSTITTALGVGFYVALSAVLVTSTRCYRVRKR